MSIIRGNDEHSRKKTTDVASAFAQMVLQKVGGSLVYIEKKKTKSGFLETDSVTT